ncbi:hypothetical protein PGTUg99_014933 [Puccinia graminis f. sp. tritici]|uniref:Uncharacterized protein n=1 Tax=Puccinia graminis f. sp. tritici TaxID=56615 RepID=A0A5B0QZT7_PUCGR|nr:hypothetical protein PGTUg99_014933 [Puccinia graminis f. sp. tritici]
MSRSDGFQLKLGSVSLLINQTEFCSGYAHLQQVAPSKDQLSVFSLDKLPSQLLTPPHSPSWPTLTANLAEASPALQGSKHPNQHPSETNDLRRSWSTRYHLGTPNYGQPVSGLSPVRPNST